MEMVKTCFLDFYRKRFRKALGHVKPHTHVWARSVITHTQPTGMRHWTQHPPDKNRHHSSTPPCLVSSCASPLSSQNALTRTTEVYSNNTNTSWSSHRIMYLFLSLQQAREYSKPFTEDFKISKHPGTSAKLWRSLLQSQTTPLGTSATY